MPLLTTGAGPAGKWTPAVIGASLKIDFDVARERAAGRLWQDAGKTTPAVANTDPVRVATALTGGDGSSPDDATRPVLNTDGSGHWWLTFSSVTHTQLDFTNAWSGSYSIATGLRMTTITTFGMMVVLDPAGEELRLGNGDGKPMIASQATGQTAQLASSILNTDVVLTATADPANTAINIYSTSGETATNSISAAARTVSLVRLGERSAAQFPFHGRVYGAVVTSAVLSAAQRALLQTYLRGLYP